ncbi:MAG TPA: VWA domain-containing protein, partial [Candidatus Binataceae bacterium]|nr:VWA domain-containing protein [Candidatus Binataceae bacterium]
EGAACATGSAPEGAEPAAQEGGAAEAEVVGDALAGSRFGRDALIHRIAGIPFADYSDLEYHVARDTLAMLKRRLRVRLSRRLRMARSGRIDFRRTIRAGIQRGGKLADLRFRARRPRHVDLLLLTDISGSVRYASTLMLDLAAGVSECFRRVWSFVYVDRIAEAGFERGHLVMTPVIDLHARSDFGHVLGEIWERRAALLNRATLVVILGDGRNNRRPPRVDLLREIGRRCRGIWWLNPEPPERWNTGDSVIGQYAREVDELVPCGNLRELEHALARVA